MPERCVVYGCNNTARSEKGISLYRIPYCDDNRQVAKAGERNGWNLFGGRETNGRQVLVQLFAKNTSRKTALNTVPTQSHYTKPLSLNEMKLGLLLFHL
jgi:hypothetical protein